MTGGILSREDLGEVRRELREADRTFVFTNGCFDVLHRGHVDLLREARSLGDFLAVGINDDDSVRRLKGSGRPLVPERDRAEILAALEMVDAVVLFPEDTPGALIEALVPDILVKGGDYPPDGIVGRETVEGAGGRVVRVELTPGRSTRGLVRDILERYSGTGDRKQSDPKPGKEDA
ncbi:MAG: D-glycero-beta-D-manno-heptose 1-phosphate adenylyltransferase [Gemmatimonadota bacterium]|jgi:D-beta-D-heptose 7-phosphate kinase/D-beta-D-heptose 1-phosphate adenosyltransferase|nr:D-glycero-beta-D-manno-heptose 1-phosphate adenylyltransferase [Gemmatimonadota bacterium]MDP6802196.1 D-glycero-beta-D-manno-heptose 1-phosphate adenylyltransferase [Gemmatimonadota bacterium]MDP7031526.1 D-glycero-beta-D-manno-heptose 1-phosphate adenylyltransferase [Gemmatimonadota bacterium]